MNSSVTPASNNPFLSTVSRMDISNEVVRYRAEFVDELGKPICHVAAVAGFEAHDVAAL